MSELVKVRYIEGGHEALIRAQDFDEALHERVEAQEERTGTNPTEPSGQGQEKQNEDPSSPDPTPGAGDDPGSGGAPTPGDHSPDSGGGGADQPNTPPA